MRTIRIFSRILVGIVFIFSGFVKSIDPLGSTYKFIDYFNAFHMSFLEGMALPLAILLSTLELVLGISLLLGYRMKIASKILLVFMTFFTILTLILALTNPVHDCGCFGDALILTNWQTFWKNVILMVPTLVIFFFRKDYPLIRAPRIEYSLISLFIIIGVGISLYCYNNLPLIDFRPYKTGTFIPEAMAIPEGAPENVYETTLIYKNKETGAEENFNMENFPRDNNQWEFVDAVSELISEGYEPPIHDFGIYTLSGMEITSSLIENKEYSLVLVAYNLEKSDEGGLIKANDYFRLSLAFPDLDFYALTSSLAEDIDSIKNEFKLEYEFYQVDEITLKTIVRSNPGLLLIHDGTIIDKWHFNNFPEVEKNAKIAGILEDFPFCEGCNLQTINTPPPGTESDKYETKLFYRNIISGELEEFNMENFPSGSDEWVFEDSRSELISEGYQGPLDDFKPRSAFGTDAGIQILQNPDYSLLIFVKDISSLSDEDFQKLLKLGGMAPEYIDSPIESYAFLPLVGEDLLAVSDQYLATFEYYHLDEKWFGPDNLKAVLLKDGVVLKAWSQEDFPEPESLAEINRGETLDAGMTLLPASLSKSRINSNYLKIVLFISFFLLIISVLKIYMDKRKL